MQLIIIKNEDKTFTVTQKGEREASNYPSLTFDKLLRLLLDVFFESNEK